MKKLHLLFCCCMSLLFLSGCNADTDDKTYGAPPLPSAIADGKQITVVRGSSCWSSKGSGTCVDMVSPKELLKNVEPTVVTAGSKLQLHFNYAPNESGISLWTEKGLNKQILERDHMISLPMEKGKYIYDVSARWKEGSSSFEFAVVVE